MISAVVQEAACPVVAVLEADDPTMVTEAAKRGVFAYVILEGRDQDLENALDITLRRFAEFINLQGAFGRRATIEQAKGILMARNGIDADHAYQLLQAPITRNRQKNWSTSLKPSPRPICCSHRGSLKTCLGQHKAQALPGRSPSVRLTGRGLPRHSFRRPAFRRASISRVPRESCSILGTT